jgi:hypothetical protein
LPSAFEHRVDRALPDGTSLRRLLERGRVSA